MIELDERRKQSIINFISHGQDYNEALLFNPADKSTDDVTT